ncbi:UNVERIFIED_CONTAM: hypothetical protein FKN15_012561 [Acipenser sinensis]
MAAVFFLSLAGDYKFKTVLRGAVCVSVINENWIAPLPGLSVACQPLGVCYWGLPSPALARGLAWVSHAGWLTISLLFFQRKSNKAKGKKQKRLEERAAMDAVLNLAIECQRVSMLKPGTVDWAYELTRANMQTLYEQSEWGWKDREKRDEMTDERAWYLTVRDADSSPLAFSHFRFDVECGEEVLYWFEIDEMSPSMSGCCGDDCSYEILSRKTKHGEAQHSHGGGHCGGCCH